MDDRVDWVAGLEQVSGSAAIGRATRSAAGASRRQACIFLTRAWPLGSARLSRPISRTGSAALPTPWSRQIATRAGVLVMPEREREATLGRSHRRPGLELDDSRFCPLWSSDWARVPVTAESEGAGHRSFYLRYSLRTAQVTPYLLPGRSGWVRERCGPTSSISPVALVSATCPGCARLAVLRHLGTSVTVQPTPL